jgi:hypothetical protein
MGEPGSRRWILWGVGSVEVAAGVIGVTGLVRTGAFSDINTVGLGVLFGGLFIAMAVVGLKLLRGQFRVLRWAALLLIPQLVSLRVPGFEYELAIPMGVFFGWSRTAEGMTNIGFWTTTESFRTSFDAAVVGYRVQLNLLALAGLVLLLRASRGLPARNVIRGLRVVPASRASDE